MNAMRAEYIIVMGVLPLVLMSGCSYFAKETYLAGKPENQWRQVGFAKGYVSYKCDKRNVNVFPSVLKSKMLVEMILIIPIPSDHILKAADDSELYELTLELRPGGNTCAIDDISLKVRNDDIKPSTASQAYAYNSPSVTACRYRFNIPVRDLTSYSISFNSSSWGCQIPPLEMERKSGVHNYAPP